jgi:Protein of unknown function (DUF2637)
VTGRTDLWIRRTTIGCAGMLAVIAGTVSYLHMHVLVELFGEPGWVAALTPLSVDGMIVAASTTLLAEFRSGGRGGFLPWALLVVGSVASLAANVAVADPTATGRVIAAWPSFALSASRQRPGHPRNRPASSPGRPDSGRSDAAGRPTGRGREAQVLAWQWALANRSGDGSLPSGSDVGRQHGRHKHWGRLVKRSGLAGELDPQT